jgi:pimeloyl-ACP methyl ester carboxylesterase
LEPALKPRVHQVSAGEVQLSVREWPGEDRSFLLVHGLASNARTWDGVARRLNAAGHRVIAVDQRGHGLSDKPDGDYGFEAVTGDLRALTEVLRLERPIVAGQSWGGNVVLSFGARYPEVPAGLVLVDGGFIYLQGQADGSWESIAQRLKPPDLLGTPRERMAQMLRDYGKTWDDEQIEMQMGNYEVLPDGTIRPWLTLERHMLILRALWDQDPEELVTSVIAPVLVAVADVPDEERRQRRDEYITRLAAKLRRADVRHFVGAHHDIHVDHPEALSRWILDSLAAGFFDN